MDAPRIVRDGIDVRSVRARADGLSRRLAAWGLDTALILGYLIGFPMILDALGMTDAVSAHLGFILLAYALWLGVPPLYFVVMECSPLQGTLGKWLVGVKVTDMAGRRLTLAQSTGRTMAKVVSAAVCWPAWLVSLFLIIWTKDRRALHDRMAGTLVVWPGDVPWGVPPADLPRAATPTPPAHPAGITPTRDGVRETGQG